MFLRLVVFHTVNTDRLQEWPRRCFDQNRLLYEFVVVGCC